MRYEHAFKYYVNRPGGWNNLLLVGVCSLIPVVGNIVMLGYMAEVAERLLRDPEMKDYPDFSFDRFAEYLKRGLWPFLVQLIVGTALGVVIAIVGGIPLAIASAIDLAVLGIIAFAVVELIGVIVAGLIVWPGTLQAQLANKFDVDGLKAFVPSFWKVLGIKAYLSLVVFWLIAVGITLVGLMLCVVGVIPASALVHMATQHLLVQHYRMYLDAGGAPIEEKSTPRKLKKPPEPDPMSPDDGGALDLD